MWVSRPQLSFIYRFFWTYLYTCVEPVQACVLSAKQPSNIDLSLGVTQYTHFAVASCCSHTTCPTGTQCLTLFVQATAQLDQKRKELSVHLQKMGVGLGSLGKRVVTGTTDLFDQVPHLLATWLATWPATLLVVHLHSSSVTGSNVVQLQATQVVW